MIFCSDCFCNPEVKSIIEKRGAKGNCPICGAENVPIYDTEQDVALVGMFDKYCDQPRLNAEYAREAIRKVEGI